MKNYKSPDPNPLSNFPQGGKVPSLLPPWGKAGKGVIDKKTSSSRIILILIFVLTNFISAYPQEDSKKADLSGYVSTLTSAMFESAKDPFIIDHLIHNRLNFKGYISPSFTFAAEARNRLFMGDIVRISNNYSDMIAADRGLMDLSWNIADERSFFINTTIDRLWIDYNSGKFQATAGRQRINWGQALVWNPNDIFNAYSYFDFDYVERPGSDAIRLQYYTGSSSAIELAVKADDNEEVTAAAMYRFNRWGYDLQVLSGILENDEFVAGLGWSGAIGSVSIRGEGSWFQPFNSGDTTGKTILLTAGADKIFNNNAMLQAQVLISNNPYDFGEVTSLYTRNMSVRDLAFSKFSMFGSFSYPVTPLFTASVSGMWFPDREGFFSGLSADYSAAENIDFSLLWQHFNGVFGSGTRTKINLCFLRIKYSF